MFQVMTVRWFIGAPDMWRPDCKIRIVEAPQNPAQDRTVLENLAQNDSETYVYHPQLVTFVWVSDPNALGGWRLAEQADLVAAKEAEDAKAEATRETSDASTSSTALEN